MSLICSAGGDWGYNAPGCIGWFLHLPDGHYHLVQEYKFQGFSVEDVAKDVKRRTALLSRYGVKKLAYFVLDPSCWAKTGAGKGEAIAETFARHGLPMKKGDNDRKNGWLRVHEMFRLDAEGHPWLTVDPSCTYLRRTIPAAVSDKKEPDDVDTTGDDHGLDMLRYWAMSRPAPTRVSSSTKFAYGTLGYYKSLDVKKRGPLARRAA